MDDWKTGIPKRRNRIKKLYGAIEAGGTKFVCAVGRSPDDILSETRFPTTLPSETLARTIEFFRPQRAHLAGIGIGSFGPLDLDTTSPSYGRITSTPKTTWEGANLFLAVKEALDVPVRLDTDVNAAALGEHLWGAAQGLSDFVYLTVGTGIGGGGMTNSQLMHGLLHPEMGHMRVPHDLAKDPFGGICRFHGDCLEGLACGPAIQARWGRPAEELASAHPAWKLEAAYLALAIANLIFSLSPQRIILGGGVMQQPVLLALIGEEVRKLLNDYLRVPQFEQGIENYIVSPRLGPRAGVLGALALARDIQSRPESKSKKGD